LNFRSHRSFFPFFGGNGGSRACPLLWKTKIFREVTSTPLNVGSSSSTEAFSLFLEDEVSSFLTESGGFLSCLFRPAGFDFLGFLFLLGMGAWGLPDEGRTVGRFLPFDKRDVSSLGVVFSHGPKTPLGRFVSCRFCRL